MAQQVHILFLCVANSARSQLAEGLAKAIFGMDAQIESAGSQPSGVVQPWAVRVLQEDGIDISKNWSKSVSDLPSEFVEKLDFVITLCAEEICPVLPTTALRLHWPIQDPASAEESVKAEAFRKAKLEIHARLTEFKNEKLWIGFLKSVKLRQ